VKEAYLTPPQEKNLIDYVVGHSEAYAHFVHWADREELPPERRYTEASWRVWLQRHRAQIKAVREAHRQATWTGSTFDRKKRLQELEESYEKLRGLISDDPKTVIAIEEQKRKLLEFISRERGEFGQKVSPDEQATISTNEKLSKAFGGLSRNA
jgi:hypothetical protein